MLKISNFKNRDNFKFDSCQFVMWLIVAWSQLRGWQTRIQDKLGYRSRTFLNWLHHHFLTSCGIYDRLWSCAACNKTFSAECVGGSDAEKFELGIFDWKLPTASLAEKKRQQPPTLYTSILYKQYSSSVILHHSGSSCSSYLNKLLQILDIFLACSNFRE